jgi:RiboL-PSP-HEPN
MVVSEDVFAEEHQAHGLVGSMPSHSYREWLSTRAKALDEIEAAHASVGGTGPGRRYATQQINQAYAVLVASQFQGFCRDLHTESVARLMAFINPPALVLDLVRARFTKGRQLDSKNAQPGSLGSDFGLLGIKFWDEVDKHHPKNNDRKRELEDLNDWRNAIAHQNFAEVSPGGAPNLTLKQGRRWRSVCGRLALSFDEVMRRHLQSLVGTTPWPL